MRDVIIPDDCVMIHANRDVEVQTFLDKHKLQATRNTRFWNQTVWQFTNPSDRTLFLLRWL
jgi:hypothetical protein